MTGQGSWSSRATLIMLHRAAASNAAILAIVMALVPAIALAQVAPTGPVPGTVMTPEYARVVAKQAYIWGWPMVNLHNRRETYRPLPVTASLGNVRMAPLNRLVMFTDYVDPLQRDVAHPNQDVVYGAGIISADKGPVVIQVPDFGDRFWLYQLANQRTDSFGSIGRQHATKPGFYLLAPSSWKGVTPAGIQGVLRFDTSVAVVLPRVFMADSAEDRAAVQSIISQIAMYPLADFDGKTKRTDWNNLISLPKFLIGGDSKSERKFVLPEKFFDQLGTVLDGVPPLRGEEALVAQFRALLAAAARDPAVKAAINQAAVEAEREVVDPLFRLSNDGVALPGYWTRIFNGAAFGYDYLTRLAIAKSNIFVNQNAETTYIYQYRDRDGQRLTGTNRYQVTFKKGELPPVRGFWSLTIYNSEHFFDINDIKRNSTGTKNKALKFAADGSLTIYVQRDRPTEDRVANWLPAPAGDFAMTLRAYWPDDKLAKGDWVPPPVERTK